MSDDLFDIIFRGDVAIGHSIVDVKQRLGQLFKIDGAKVDSLFTGRAIPLKRNLDSATAQKYQDILQKAGAQVELRAAGGQKKPAPAARSKSSIQPQSDLVKPDQPAKKLTLKERLALQEQQDKKEKERQEKQVETSTSEADQTQSSQEYGWNLAPLGSSLILTKEVKTAKAAVKVDVSEMSLKPEGGDLLDDSEKPEEIVATVAAGDFDVEEAGAELLKPEERQQEEAVTVDTTGIDISEVGVDLLDASERLQVPELDIDTGIFDLAPAGSDLGQKRNDPAPPPPDTSTLELAD